MHKVRIALHDVPDPEGLLRLMQQRAADLAADFPALLSSRLTAERVATAEGEDQWFDVGLELLLQQHQIILHRAGPKPKAALDEALAATRLEIERLALRDPAVAPARKAAGGARPIAVAA